MIEISINGLKKQVKDGLTIMQACESHNITIPHFCYHDKLSIAGNCRMCLVEAVENPNNPIIKRIASCARNVSPGMQIFTNTAVVKKAREGVLEFLLANHPLDCPICDQGGECDLQDQSLIFGGDRGRFYESKRSVEDKNCGPLIKTLMTRCIHCTRCIRFASEVAGVPILGTTGRGSQMEVGFYIEKVLNSEVSGNVIDLCPVGALTSKPYAFTARSWELKSFNSMDLFDAFGSNIRVDTRGTQIMRVLPRINAYLNEDWISDKVRFAYDGLKYQRLLSPFLRLNNSYVKVSWQKAFYAIRSYLIKASSSSKESSLGLNIRGIAGNFVDAEALVCLKDLINKLGSGDVSVSQDNAKFSNDFPSDYLFSTPISDIEKSDLCLLIGSNPRLEAPILNVKLRKLFLSDVSVYNLGFSSDLNYFTKSLGNNLSTLVSILEGRHWFCQKLLNSKRPLIIVGSSFYQLQGANYSLLSHFKEFLYSSGLFRFENVNFCNFNLLHNSANTATGLDLNVTSPTKFSNRSLFKSSFNYLLGADDLHTELNSGFTVYQGHHGDVSVSKANVVLPSVTYFEKNSRFLNLEGSVNNTRGIFFNLGQARNDWKILVALSHVLDCPLMYSDKKSLTDRLSQLSPKYSLTTSEPSFYINKWALGISKPLGIFQYFSVPFSSFVNNFYLNDAISRSSKTMSLCSSVYNLKSNLF